MLLNIILFLTGFNTYLVLWIIFWKDKYYITFCNNEIEIWKIIRSWDGIKHSERQFLIKIKS